MINHLDIISQSTDNPESNITMYLDLMSAIVWRIDIVDNAISFLNNAAIQSDSEQIHAILQNPQSARDLILEDDRERFQQSYDQILNRRKTSCVFRLRRASGLIRWFKLVAFPDPSIPHAPLARLWTSPRM